MEAIEIKDKAELDVKRFHLPVTIDVKCPNCGKDAKIDMSQDYISYPTINEKISIGGWCSECEECFRMDAKLKISLEVDKSTLCVS